MWKKILVVLCLVTTGVGMGFLWKNRGRFLWRPTKQQLYYSYQLSKVRKLYKIDTALLPERLKEVWKQSSLDPETEAWLEPTARRGLLSTIHNYYLHYGMSLLIRMQYSRTDISGMLGRDMYVFSQEILRNLLPAEFKPKLIMDIGAGSGSETHKAMEALGLHGLV